MNENYNSTNKYYFLRFAFLLKKIYILYVECLPASKTPFYFNFPPGF